MNKYYMILLYALFISVSVEAAEAAQPSVLDNGENLQVETYFKDFYTPESIEEGKYSMISSLNDKVVLREQADRTLTYQRYLDEQEKARLRGDIERFQHEIDRMQKVLPLLYREAYKKCFRTNRQFAHLFLKPPSSSLRDNTPLGLYSFTTLEEFFKRYFLKGVSDQSFKLKNHDEVLDRNASFFFTGTIDTQSIHRFKRALIESIESELSIQKEYRASMEQWKEESNKANFKMYEEALIESQEKLEEIMPLLCDKYLVGYKRCLVRAPLLAESFLEKSQNTPSFLSGGCGQQSAEKFEEECFPSIRREKEEHIPSQQIWEFVKDGYASERLSIGNVWRSLKDWFRK